MLFNTGTKEVYIVIANELRKLICDKNIKLENPKDNSLLLKIFSSINFSPIKSIEKMPQNNLVFQSYESMQFNGNGDYKITNLFDTSKPKIPYSNWLKQTMMFSKGSITLEQIIKSVSDKEGAHSDDDYNDTIKQINYFIISGKDTRPYYITAIGEYILSEIKENAKTLLL